MNKLTIKTDRFSKAIIKKEANDIVDIALNGDNDPLQVYFYLKALEEMIKIVKSNKDFDFAVKEQINRYSDRDSSVYGVNFQTVTRRSFSYDNSELKELEAKKVGIDAKIKAIQKYLQTINEPVVNSDTGELMHPATVQMSEYVKTTFEKE